MQCSYRITTGRTNQCCIITTGRCDILIVPGIRQLSLANGDSLLTDYIWINDKIKCSYRITTGSTNQCCIIITSPCNVLSIPCIGQLSLANGDSLLTGYIWINDKVKSSDRITTSCRYQISCIITAGSYVLIIPAVR